MPKTKPLRQSDIKNLAKKSGSSGVMARAYLSKMHQEFEAFCTAEQAKCHDFDDCVSFLEGTWFYFVQMQASLAAALLTQVSYPGLETSMIGFVEKEFIALATVKRKRLEAGQQAGGEQ
ncbi:hypothetical protein [Agrobacterium vitis]|uniref:hypothetical protein n=1 Tax=Agrobacterium vitis TaxID=373 RepID=UPI00115FD321|nr:hypothetical protein [Agrobacterium vitis]MUO84838.1 hypothetical protein [Agrobacterium vitis]